MRLQSGRIVSNSNMNVEIVQNTLKSYFKFDFDEYVILIFIICVLLCFFLHLKRRMCERIIHKRDVVYSFLLATSIAFVFALMLVVRLQQPEYSFEFTLFWSYKNYMEECNRDMLLQIIYNILAFLPWPILFVQVFPKMKKLLWSVGSAFLFSVFVETMQLVFRLGLFEFDDMFHNTLGALIGYGILAVFTKLKKKGEKK